MSCKNCKCKDLTSHKLIEQMDDLTKPFTEDIINDTEKIRYFDPSADDHLFKWHWDEEDRWVEAINENDWLFQFDDVLPQSIEPNKIIMIPEGIYHRLIKGSNPLMIKISNTQTSLST